MALELPAPLTETDKDFAERRTKIAARRKEKRLARSLRLTLADMEYALVKFDGSLSHASEFLGCARHHLKIKVEETPSLIRLQKDIREKKVDLAEYKLHQQVKEGYFPAVSLTLKTLGKDRGYTEKFDVEHELGPHAAGTAAALIEAMRRGTFELPEPAVEIEASEWEVVESK